MSGYGDIKTKRILKLLTWLQNNKGIDVKKGGNHNLRVECIHNGNAYPLPTSHNIVNKHIVKDFQGWLEKNDICSKEEFDKKL